MTKWSILAAAVIVLGSATAAEAGYRPDPAATTVEGWYQQYLGRCADPSGLNTWAGQLRCGKSPDCVLAGILASDEYYHRNGCCDAGFVKGLYHDRLVRCPSDPEVRQWLGELGRCRSRYDLSLKFLAASQRELRGW
jgi:hypothetical protein